MDQYLIVRKRRVPGLELPEYDVFNATRPQEDKLKDEAYKMLMDCPDCVEVLVAKVVVKATR